ncbi:DEAD/DEAH box helicase [Paenibacillus azoreducens]|uniref:ATP-dependent helicase YwqA n=1 Tax=Paenibacillus azoreducens TaxID=116718 RepID=A0A920CTH0_9BACL|nr:DEAD/DEAH box helicase [Paenibacillus azoreducens]GIO48387.1 putative ATP-dependent helicase YwqA [Paenibacillus azoreducens]
MSSYLAFADAITVHVRLSAYGDALIYGSSSSHRSVPGLDLKQRLFAWHEASFYGTELEIRQMQGQGVQLVVLPAEQVLPFFAERALLHHITWEWDQDAEALLRLAPTLVDCVCEKRFIPSFASFREGKLQWTWDRSLMEDQIRQRIDRSRPEFAQGLQSAFSALVFQSCYGTESAATDLRREYPMLFASGAATGGLQEKEWLISIGWKADMAPFRPLLQLLEPDEDSPAWRLKLVLQDKFDPSVLVPVRLGPDGHVSGVWPDSWSFHVKERSAGWGDHLRASLPGFVEQGHSDDLLGKPLSDGAAWQFLTVDSRRLLESGWQVLLPAWWEAASRKKPKLRAKVRADEGDDKRQSGGNSLFGLDSIIQFDWRIAIGETQLTESEFQELVARNERLVRFRGEWMTLDPALIKQIGQMMEGMDRKQGLSFQDVLQLHLQKKDDWAQRGKEDQSQEDETNENSTRIELEVELNEHLMELFNQLGQRSEWPRLAVPQGLKAELRNYQYDGFSWLAFMRRFGLGACLADDMGLGKTVQFITYLLHLKENGGEEEQKLPSLLICPTSVLGNWQKELGRFAPSLNVMLHYGSRRSDEEAFRREIRHADIVLTSYATATLDQDILKAVAWESLCLDEAQNIKNAQTKQSSAVRSFPARHRIALTGTPIENRLSELWSLYDFMNPGYLGNLRAFSARFIQPIEKERDEERTQQLQKLVKPFMLRRKKKDPAIQLALPEKNEMKTYIHLTSEQGALYDQTVNDLMNRVQKLEGIQRKGAILSALTHLKQICDHPLLLTGESFEYPKDEDQSMNTEALLSRSAKLERLLDMVRELREEGDRCLIFTQYIGMGEMLQRVLQQELKEPVLYLNGSTSKSARDRMIEQFQSQTLPPEEQPSVFILSIKAGGVGLNLTAANHVFHFDRWWNPAVENQATDRAYRMGQTKDVQVHKFISLGTLEERIDEMLESKQQLSDNVISSTESWITELSTEALKDLFTLRSDWNG